MEGKQYDFWIDYNANGVFDGSERLANGSCPFTIDATPPSNTFLIIIPTSGIVFNQNLRMRLGIETASDPCKSGAQSYDFSVKIMTVDNDNDNDGFDNVLDCNDNNPNIHPNATEICDSIDNNCNAQTDENFTLTTYYADTDQDGYGSGLGADYCVDPGVGFSANDSDCDDNNSAINPAALEIIDNDIDENCDSLIEYTGIAELVNRQITIFPNPGIDLITVSLKESHDFEWKIYSTTGTLIDDGKVIQKTETKINTSKLETGVYFIVISINGNNRTYSWVKSM